ncbi:hypothetical protein Tco_0667150, partial [Tanacetum coccineum]
DNLKMEMEMEIPSVKASANSDIVYFFTSAQDGDPLQDDVRLCLGDDLKKAQDHNQRQVKDESKDHYPKLIKAIYEEDGNLNKDVSGGVRTCWGINVADYIRLKLGNGENTRF